MAEPQATQAIEADEARPASQEGDADSTLGEDNSTFTASITSSILKYRTLNGRTYHSDRIGDNYWGSNDERQSDFLDIGHHVFTLLLDGKLYGAPLSDNVQDVLDLGTGTGSWAIDFADAHPNSQVIGTDISPIQPTWVPPNVKFVIDDFTQSWTFPENHFDFIHVRWVAGTVPDWDVLFKQAYRCLKPGGWLESLDNDGFFRTDDDTISSTSAVAEWKSIALDGAKKLGVKSSFAPVRDNLQRPAMDAAGFTNVKETSYKIPISEWPKEHKLKEVGLYCRAMLESDTEGTVGLLANALGYSPEQISIFAARLRRDMRSLNVHAYYCAKQVYGQKPKE